MLSSNNYPENVQVVVSLKGKQQSVDLGTIPQPLTFGDLQERLSKQGFPELFVLVSRPTPCDLKITSAPSNFNGVSGQINLDQPLLHFYNNVYLQSTDSQNFDSTATSAVIGNYNKVKVGDLASIGFERTIRVPDNDKVHALPPGLGPFELFNVGDFTDRLPKSVVSKGGIFVSMYQKEAMWMSFRPLKPCALKVSVGGINALTGTPQGVSVKGKQDYLPLEDVYGQLWLDGMSTAPGVVRQFVAVPLGHNHTVEGQLTGRESEGGIQIDTFTVRHESLVLLKENPSRFWTIIRRIIAG